MRVLVIDDKASIRQAMSKILTTLGLSDITQAVDGQEAWDLLLEAVEKKELPAFDLVVSDMEMPRMTGLELLENIRNHKKLKKMPFIMATTVTAKQIILKTMALGVQAYIIKPFDKAIVELKLKQAGIL